MIVSDELATYLRPGPFSVLVAGCDSNLVPEAVRGWYAHLSEDGNKIEVLVGREPSRRLLENLEETGRIAVSIANVTTYQALQLKGRWLGVAEAEESDHEGMREHLEQLVNGFQRVGISQTAGRGLAVGDLIRLQFVPDDLFDQTPGPEAGSSR